MEIVWQQHVSLRRYLLRDKMTEFSFNWFKDVVSFGSENVIYPSYAESQFWFFREAPKIYG